MTGFDSKRQMAQDKLNDEADTLTIVYQSGFADGKRSAQRKPLTDQELDVLAMDSDGTPNSHLEFARAIEAAHNIKEQP